MFGLSVWVREFSFVEGGWSSWEGGQGAGDKPAGFECGRCHRPQLGGNLEDPLERAVREWFCDFGGDPSQHSGSSGALSVS